MAKVLKMAYEADLVLASCYLSDFICYPLSLLFLDMLALCPICQTQLVHIQLEHMYLFNREDVSGYCVE